LELLDLVLKLLDLLLVRTLNGSLPGVDTSSGNHRSHHHGT
jgi:hypothetical protein